MAKLFVQGYQELLSYTAGSLSANACISGSIDDVRGYGIMVGGVQTNASTVAACGIFVEQSFDRGVTWSLISASNAITACTTAACATTIVGNAIRVRIHNGTTAASIYRAYFYVRPI